jgi:hypothetical protein
MIELLECNYSAEDSQDSCTEIADLDNSDDWKSKEHPKFRR